MRNGKGVKSDPISLGVQSPKVTLVSMKELVLWRRSGSPIENGKLLTTFLQQEIARVAVMRKLAKVIWHMLRSGKTYGECRQLAKDQAQK